VGITVLLGLDVIVNEAGYLGVIGGADENVDKD
jgi:hypothetical protein